MGPSRWSTVVPVAVALGSNLGDRHANLTWAIGALRPHLSDLRASSFHDTEPVGVVDDHPRYLNAAVVGTTKLAPRGLLEVLLDLERARGRERRAVRAPRTLDLDLILYGDRIINEPDLQVPHPRYRDRRFVLDPLREIAAGWLDPVTGHTIEQLDEAVRTR